MKKSLVLLAGVSMAFIGLPAISHAQAASGPFADVPTDHWAYQSVDTLQKAGIVIGYPDGTYGGRRPMTRYEFAVAIARLLAQMNKGGSAADLAALRTDLEGRIAGNTAAVDELRKLVDGFGPELTRLGVDVAAANARLDALEAKVSALDTRVTNNEGKISALAAEQARIHITGEFNTIFEGASSQHRDGNGNYVPFLDKNGQTQLQDANFFNSNIPQPPGRTQFGNHLLTNSSVYEDVLLHIRGRLTDTATANVDLDFGNYLGQIGNLSNFGPTAGGVTPGAGNFAHNTNSFFGFGNSGNFNDNIYKAYLDAAVKLGPLGGAELLVGRFGNQYTKYTLKLADADIYTNLTQTDSGDILGDGAGLKLKAGPASLSGFAVKLNSNAFMQPYGGSVTTKSLTGAYPSGFAPTAQVRPGGLISANHGGPLTQGIGARATFGAPEGATLGFTVEQFAIDNPQNGFANGLGGFGNGSANGLNAFDGLNDPNRTGKNAQYNRLSVYGVDFNGALPLGLPGVKKGGILVDAAYTVSAHGRGQHFNDVGNSFRYHSTDDQIGATFGGLTLKGGYQYVGPDFSAPGYWGKVGAWTNPTNIRGPVVSVKYAFTPKLSFNGDYEQYKAAYGTDGNGGKVNSPLQQGDHLTRYQAGFGFGLSSAYAVDLGYENVQYKLNGSTDPNGGGVVGKGHPTESYVNIGLGHSISPTASFKLLYQIVHYDDQRTNFDPSSEQNSNGKTNGSIATAQFQLKF